MNTKWEKNYKLLTLILFIAFAINLSFFKKGTLGVMWLIVLLWLVEGNFKQKWIRFKETGNLVVQIAIILLPILYIIGLAYTSNMQNGMFSIEQKASLLFMPIVIFSFNPVIKTKEFFTKVILAFIVGICLSAIFCLVRAWIAFMGSGDAGNFYYSDLSYFHHPGYYSLYVTIGIAATLYIMDGYWRKISSLSKISLVAGLLFMTILNMLLSSKAGIISMVLVIGIAFLYTIVVRRKYLLAIFSVLTIGLMIFAGLKFLSFTGNRMNMEGGSESINSVSVRLAVWKSSINVIKGNFIFGTGTGDYHDEMRKEFDENSVIIQELGFRNSHNQYLQTFVTLGVIGFLALLVWLIAPFYVAWKKNHYFYMAFLVVVAFNFSIESMLETQSGIVFITFMHTWFLTISDKIAVRN